MKRVTIAGEKPSTGYFLMQTRDTNLQYDHDDALRGATFYSLYIHYCRIVEIHTEKQIDNEQS